ncbi:MAG: HAD-IB family hydrolase [Bacteroidetes bacterium]|nr:HAD-IB family hydrolase [Bacteroidota bacterium]
MSRSIAFFDFDGTITTKDTLLEFIKFSKGTLPFYLGFALNSPWLVAYRLKLISNQAAKERILTWFFGKTPLKAFQETCDRFSDQEIPALLRPKAVQEIRQLQEKGFEVVIVSASPENWLRKWTQSMDLKLIATKLEIKEVKQTLTGKIQGINCHGKEKVRRIQEAYTLEDYHAIHAYGDTSGDKPMLALAQHPFYKPFR